MLPRLLGRRSSVRTGATDSHANRTHHRHPCFERLESRRMLSINGDFDGDGFDDLAIGAPMENVGAIVDAGAVSIVYGGRKGLLISGNQFWHQNSPGVNGVAATGDRFGSALAVGDFNGDGFSDLAIGVRTETVNGKILAGAVNVLYGSANGLSAASDQLWTQDSPGINDTADPHDQFGRVLAAGNFNGDGRDDLAIGAADEQLGSVEEAGIVNVIYGSSIGLTNANDQHWHQDRPGINDAVEIADSFGAALAAGDFNGDGRDDLAIGANAEAVQGVEAAGLVNVIYGSASGLTASGDQSWHQATSGVAGDPDPFDAFGFELAAGDFDGDDFDDLAIGVPFEEVSLVADAGLVAFLYGSSSKLQTSGGRKDISALELGFSAVQSARFGSVPTTGDFDDNGRDDLAIGAPMENLLVLTAAGAAYVVFGSSSGPAVSGAKRWVQNDLGGASDIGEGFASALVTGDYDGDGRADLAIGVASEDDLGAENAGAVHIIFAHGLIDRDRCLWHQDLLDSSDGVEANDLFGDALG